METKEAIKTRIEAQLEEWKADFNKLKAETKGAYAEGVIEGSEEYKSLKANMEEAEGKLEKLKDSSEGDIESLKKEIDQTWNGVKSSFENLKKKFQS